ncbi:MAG: HAMP domain-containing histidine kinase, partial [Sphingomonadales bacterium]
MRRFFPKSLTGQIALLVGIALFIAQAINFGLLLNERRGARFAQVIAPAVTRIVDAAERAGNPELRPDRRRPQIQRVTMSPSNPIDPRFPRETRLEQNIRTGLTDAGVQYSQVIAVIRDVDMSQPFFKNIEPVRAERIRRLGAELNVAVELPGKGWLMLRSGWPRSERTLIWQLLAQTLILYVVVLLPVLWAGRRIARPLRNLAQATLLFRPGEQPDPVEERGPADVRAVISAYNALSLRVNAMLDEKDRMLGAIGHDLRTPLMALRVRIESVEDDEDRNRMADTIEEMSRTLDDILSLARLG